MGVYSYDKNKDELTRVDKGGGGIKDVSADIVSYDNTASGIESTNVQSAIDEVVDVTKSAIDEVVENRNVGYLQKNLLPNNATSNTINGVTFTVNADGSVLVNGTASATTNFNFPTFAKLKGGIEYLLSGIPLSSLGGNFRIDLRQSGTMWIDNTESKEVIQNSNNESVSFTPNADVDNVYGNIRVASGTTVNNLTVYPMIRRAYIEDSTYVQYSKSNVELTQAQNMIGDGWLSSKTYAVGDYCIRDSALYKCKVQHSNQQPPNATYWDKVSVASEIMGLSAIIAVDNISVDVKTSRQTVNGFSGCTNARSYAEKGYICWAVNIFENGTSPIPTTLNTIDAFISSNSTQFRFSVIGSSNATRTIRVVWLCIKS